MKSSELNIFRQVLISILFTLKTGIPQQLLFLNGCSVVKVKKGTRFITSCDDINPRGLLTICLWCSPVSAFISVLCSSPLRLVTIQSIHNTCRHYGAWKPQQNAHGRLCLFDRLCGKYGVFVWWKAGRSQSTFLPVILGILHKTLMNDLK